MRVTGAGSGVGIVVAMLLACGDRGGDSTRADEVTKPADPPLEVSGLTLEVARAPADGRPFVAGERVRIGLRIDGGRPPYTVAMRGAVAAASVQLDVAASAEAALIARIDPTTAAGARQIVLDVRDTVGQQKTTTLPIEILAVDVAVVAPDLAPDLAQMRLLDTAGRARNSFHWSEELVVSARIEPGERARLRMWDETGRDIAGIADVPIARGVLELPIAIPRLAASGTYGIEVDTDTGARARAVFEVRGQEFLPADELAIDRLVLRGGDDGRAPRAGIIRRGERLVIEARVAGAQTEVRATLRVRRSKLLHEAAWPPTRPAASGPTRRLLVTGYWEVPRDIAPGRLQLELELTEGDHVSAIHRDLLVR